MRRATTSSVTFSSPLATSKVPQSPFTCPPIKPHPRSTTTRKPLPLFNGFATSPSTLAYVFGLPRSPPFQRHPRPTLPCLRAPHRKGRSKSTRARRRPGITHVDDDEEEVDEKEEEEGPGSP
jgi:hypothetical protein